MTTVWILLAIAAVLFCGTLLCFGISFLLDGRPRPTVTNASLVDDGTRIRARLFTAYGTMAGQTRGLQRQRKLINRLRTQVNVLTVQRDHYRDDYLRLHKDNMELRFPGGSA